MQNYKILRVISSGAFFFATRLILAQFQSPSPPLFPDSTNHVNVPVRADAMVREHRPKIALEHVTLFEGGGAPPKHDQTIIIDHGKILAVGSSKDVVPSGDTKVLDETGKTLLPGLIGMHEHLFYQLRGLSRQLGMYSKLGSSGPMLYLAVGITTTCTAGSIKPYLDSNLRKAIESGREAGPDLDVTGPYLEGPPALQIPVHELDGSEDARNMGELLV